MDGAVDGVPDARFGPDANYPFCDAAPGSAQITVRDGTTTLTFDRVHIGAILGGGALAPVAPDPISVQVMFTTLGEMTETDVYDCIGLDYAHCPASGAVLRVDGITGPGTYPVHYDALQHPGLDAQGTLTITQLRLPDSNGVGHVQGSVTTTAGVDSVAGTFENDICVVSVPI